LRNEIHINPEHLSFIKEQLGLNDLEPLNEIIRKHENIETIISDIVQFFINSGMYGVAQELNLPALNEENDVNTGLKGHMPLEFKNRYVKLFCGKGGAYARGYSDINGDRNYYKVNMSLSMTEIEKMLEDRHSIGVYPLDDDDTCTFIVLDIDMDKRILIQCGDEGILYESMIERAKKFAFEVKNFLGRAGVVSYVEFSGYKGFHIWVFFNSRANIDNIRRFILSLTSGIKPPNGLKLEIIPAMYHDEEEIIKIPLSYHELTNRQSVFIDDEGETVKNQLEYIYNIIENDVSILKTDSLPDAQKDEIGETVKSDARYSGIGDFPEYVRAIYEKCRLIKLIVDKAFNESYLNHFERNALLYVFGHAGDKGRDFIHFILSRCLNYNFEVTEGFISRIKEKPVSCQKLILRFSHLSEKSDCSCVFDEYPLFYPSPVIYGYMVE